MTKTLAGFAMVLAACSSHVAADQEAAALPDLEKLKTELCACTTSDCGKLANIRFESRLGKVETRGPRVQAILDRVHDCRIKLVDLAAETERCSPKLRIAMERVLIDKARAAPGPYKSIDGNPWPEKIYDHCHDDLWPAEVVRCMTAAETRKAFDGCVAVMPADLRAKLGADAKS